MKRARSPYPPGRRILAYAVHLYTASNAMWSFFAAMAIQEGDFRLAFVFLITAVVIDATDGPLARRWQVKRVVPRIDGRRLDDIVDYLVYTFLPILLVWRAGWFPAPAWLWAAIPLVASLFAFSNTDAKAEGEGFFLGFPSYWNVVAFYAGLWFPYYGAGFVLALVLGLSLLSLLPLRFVYPNRARRWRAFFIVGGFVWLAMIVLMLVWYPAIPLLWTWLSFVYPGTYIVLSVYLDLSSRRRADPPSPYGEASDSPAT